MILNRILMSIPIDCGVGYRVIRESDVETVL